MRLALLVVLFVSTLTAVRAEDKKPTKDEDKIVGTWQMVSGEKGGQQAPEKFVQSFRLTFKGEGKLSATAKGNKEEDGTFKLDAGKKPRQLEISIDGKTLEGIYELDGDNLKLCLGEGERPSEFKSPVGSKTMVMLLKREKK